MCPREYKSMYVHTQSRIEIDTEKEIIKNIQFIGKVIYGGTNTDNYMLIIYYRLNIFQQNLLLV